MSEQEMAEFKSKLPKPKNNIFWEQYLNTYYKCTDRIGEIIDFVRYGDFPLNRKSKYQRTLGLGLKSYPELKGVSVFEVIEGKEVRPLNNYGDLDDRIRYIGKGKIVDWGTDGEPLLEVIEYKLDQDKYVELLHLQR